MRKGRLREKNYTQQRLRERNRNEEVGSLWKNRRKRQWERSTKSLSNLQKFRKWDQGLRTAQCKKGKEGKRRRSFILNSLLGFGSGLLHQASIVSWRPEDTQSSWMMQNKSLTHDENHQDNQEAHPEKPFTEKLVIHRHEGAYTYILECSSLEPDSHSVSLALVWIYIS